MKSHGLAVRERSERGIDSWVLESGDDVSDTREDVVGGAGTRHLDLSWKPRDCIADASGAGFPNPDRVAAIGVESGSDVPTLDAVGGPTSSGLGFDVCKYTDTRGCDWGAIEVKRSMEVRPSREFWVDAAATK